MSGRISFVGVLCVAAAGVVGPAFRSRSVGLFAAGDPLRPTARAFSGWGREQHSVWERQMTLIASFSFQTSSFLLSILVSVYQMQLSLSGHCAMEGPQAQRLQAGWRDWSLS